MYKNENGLKSCGGRRGIESFSSGIIALSFSLLIVRPVISSFYVTLMLGECDYERNR